MCARPADRRRHTPTTEGSATNTTYDVALGQYKIVLATVDGKRAGTSVDTSTNTTTAIKVSDPLALGVPQVSVKLTAIPHSKPGPWRANGVGFQVQDGDRFLFDDVGHAVTTRIDDATTR